MDYTTLVAQSKAGQEQSAKGMQSLYQVCKQLTDGRGAREVADVVDTCRVAIPTTMHWRGWTENPVNAL